MWLAGGVVGFNRWPHFTQNAASPSTCVPHFEQVTICASRRTLRNFAWRGELNSGELSFAQILYGILGASRSNHKTVFLRHASLLLIRHYGYRMCSPEKPGRRIVCPHFLQFRKAVKCVRCDGYLDFRGPRK